MKTRGPVKKTSDARPAKRPALGRSSSLSPPPADLQESYRNTSTPSSIIETKSSNPSSLTLPTLAQNYVEHRDEVMGILFKLTKALKEEREWRETLLSRMTEVESRQTEIEKRQTKVETRQDEMTKRQTGLEEQMECMWEGSEDDDVEMFPEEERLYDLEQSMGYMAQDIDDLRGASGFGELEEKLDTTTGRLDALEAALEELKNGKRDNKGTTMEDALAAVDQSALHQSLLQQQEEGSARDESRRNRLRNVTDKLISDLRSARSSPEI